MRRSSSPFVAVARCELARRRTLVWSFCRSTSQPSSNRLNIFSRSRLFIGSKHFLPPSTPLSIFVSPFEFVPFDGDLLSMIVNFFNAYCECILWANQTIWEERIIIVFFEMWIEFNLNKNYLFYVNNNNKQKQRTIIQLIRKLLNINNRNISFTPLKEKSKNHHKITDIDLILKSFHLSISMLFITRFLSKRIVFIYLCGSLSPRIRRCSKTYRRSI